MGWNYRVLRFEEPDGSPWYAIHEVHYDKDGHVSSWTAEPADVGAETRDDILPVLAMMCDALTQPVLDGVHPTIIVEDKRIFTDDLTKLLQQAINSGDIDLSADDKPGGRG